MVTRLCKIAGWLALLWVTPAFAQTGATEVASTAVPGADTVAGAARLAFDDGLRLLRAEQWRDAEASFRRSLSLVPRPSAKYNLAFVLYKQNKLHESSELLQEMLSNDDAALDARYRDYAKALLGNVMAAVSVLHLAIRPDAAEVRVDGQLIAISGPERSLPVDPGAHQVQVSAPGFSPQAIEVVTTAHSESSHEIALSPLPASARTALAAPSGERSAAPPRRRRAIPARRNDRSS
jgi:tetratricopeptide (TPR) repeat protein